MWDLINIFWQVSYYQLFLIKYKSSISGCRIQQISNNSAQQSPSYFLNTILCHIFVNLGSETSTSAVIFQKIKTDFSVEKAINKIENNIFVQSVADLVTTAKRFYNIIIFTSRRRRRHRHARVTSRATSRCCVHSLILCVFKSGLLK